MNLSDDNLKDLAALPHVLRTLLDAEFAAGNALVAVEHGFPAAPCGAVFKLASPLRSRARSSGDGISYYDRNGQDYSGEITDATRHFFLLEPPNPPQPEPDMDAIRAALQPVVQESQAAEPSLRPSVPDSLLGRFERSMVLDHDRWRDGDGYDLAALMEASPDERKSIESLLLRRGAMDWRDVEALAALDTAGARKLLTEAFQHGDHKLKAAIMFYAPTSVNKQLRIAALVSALENAEIYTGLSETLREIAEFHPPEIVAALHRGVLARDGGTAVHLAAMLMFIHGKAKEPFDWEHRPFFLTFHTEDRKQREACYRELCALIGKL